jgi:hypothetical protein
MQKDIMHTFDEYFKVSYKYGNTEAADKKKRPTELKEAIETLAVLKQETPVTSAGEDGICLEFYEVRGPFEKFVDSPYYSDSELCGSVVTVSFSKYLPWQARHFLQRSTHFSKTYCRPLITSKFLASELPFMVGKAQKSHGARSGLYGGCSYGFPPVQIFQAERRIQFKSRPMRFLGFSKHENGAPRQEISK